MIRWILLAIIGLTFGGGIYTMTARHGPPPDDALSQKSVHGTDPAAEPEDAAIDTTLSNTIAKEREQLQQLQETIRLLRQDVERRHKSGPTGSAPDSTARRSP